MVYRLLGAGSVEELIYARQIYKQQQMAIAYEASIQTRYFEAVQGDSGKQGELFGIGNIFRLHEDTLATKMAIEKANLAELDWALANLSGVKPRKKTGGLVDDQSTETDVTSAKDKDETNLGGLGALFSDDAPPTLELQEQDIIQETLNTIGVRYSHCNNDILVPSRIEEERTKNLLKARRKKTRSSSRNNSPRPKIVWPPKRKHHIPPPTPEDQLAARHEALVALGMITDAHDASRFARDFARKSPKVRNRILAELDQWTKLQ